MRRLWALLAALLLLPAVARGDQVDTSAKACVVTDLRTGRVLLSHNAHTPLPMASTTKIMTALLALEHASLDEPVTCGRNAFGVPGTSIYLSLGETLSMGDMLHGLMLASGNDAAVAIAEHVGGSVERFCRMMTQRASDLGCTDTVFLTPHGLPCQGHHTTAADLAKIARAAMAQPVFREIVSMQRASIPWEGHDYDRVLNNKNKLLSTYQGALGVKTGYTRAAGRCLVSAAERDGMAILCVVLNCADWFDESARLMDMAFARWEAVTLLTEGEALRQIPVTGSNADSVAAVLADDLSGLIPMGALPQAEIDLPDSLNAPVEAGQKLGVVRMVAGGEVVAVAELVAACDVAEDDWPARVRQVAERWLAGW